MLLKVREVARRLNLSVSKVYALLDQGKLPHHRIDAAIRVSEQQLADYLEATKRERRADERLTAYQRPRPRVTLKHL